MRTKHYRAGYNNTTIPGVSWYFQRIIARTIMVATTVFYLGLFWFFRRRECAVTIKGISIYKLPVTRDGFKETPPKEQGKEFL